jgi:hypothetical protein
MTNVWEHLFLDGEFAPRARILSGLTLQDVGQRPAGLPHSIYEELWHAAMWQHIVLDQDEAAFERFDHDGGQFPPNPAPDDEEAWQRLVDKFLADSARAVKLAEDDAWLATEGDVDNPGFTWRNTLETLALHSAYHMGKIVSLRQVLGLWPKPSAHGDGV